MAFDDHRGYLFSGSPPGVRGFCHPRDLYIPSLVSQRNLLLLKDGG